MRTALIAFGKSKRTGFFEICHVHKIFSQNSWCNAHRQTVRPSCVCPYLWSCLRWSGSCSIKAHRQTLHGIKPMSHVHLWVTNLRRHFFFLTFSCLWENKPGKRRRSGQSVTASDFGSNGPRFESGRGRCVESLDKALYSHCPKEKPSH